ncbi:DsbA family protein [Patescibacteria group bacterium]
MSEKNTVSTSNKLVPILVITTIALAFGLGIMWQKAQALEGDSSPVVAGSAGFADERQLPQQPPTGSAEAVAPVNDSDHVSGDRNARIVLIEYSDYECPYCARFHPTAQQVVNEYNGQVAWVYRHFPLDTIHVNARPAAEASECVAEIGGEEAFWKFTEEVFRDQSQLSDLDALVSALGINKSAYVTCVDSGRYADHVEEEYKNGLASGVTGTPGNILLDTKTGATILIPGALPFTQVKQSIDSLLSN